MSGFLYEATRPNLSKNRLWQGVISRTVSGMASGAYVILPGIDNNIELGPANWPAINDYQMPQLADECLVAFDNNMRPWIVNWWPKTFRPMPAVKLSHSAAQSIPTGALTVLSFDTEVYDRDTMHDPADNTKITAKTAGIYTIGLSVEWQLAQGYNRRLIQINKTTLSGTTIIAVHSVDLGTQQQYDVNMISTDDYLNVGDYLTAWAFQNTISAKNVLASPEYSPRFWATRQGA